MSAARQGPRRILVCAVVVALACTLGSVPARAQVFGPFERPGETRPELPEPGPPQQPRFRLPPLPERPEGELPLSQGPSIVVREFRVTGSTVFSDAELARVAAPYAGRPVGAEELEQLRQQLTHLYVDAGYLNSGAVLPDQDVREGVVQYRIVEGRLGEIDVEGNRWFRDGYLRSRIRRSAHTPLDVADLEQELQILQQDPRIRRVEAELLPGERPGEARLRTRFEEELPFFASLEFSNYKSPSVGDYALRLDLAHRNVTGWGDALHLMGTWVEGLWEVEGGYEVPFTPWDTTFGGWYRYGRSKVVEQPFEPLDIESRAQTVGLELRQPVYRTLRNQVGVAITGEYRESETFLLGQRFPFEEGTQDGRVVVSVLRLRTDWLYRDLHQVVAARSQLSIGLDVLGATNDGCVFDLFGVCTVPPGRSRDEIPDANFVSWLGQFQWVRRFDRFGLETVFRMDLQLASEPLFSLEQFSVGGHQTVRGYREHQLVRDNGFVASLEPRVTLWTHQEWGLGVQLAPFCDVAQSWNTNGGQADPTTLASIGVGLRTFYRTYLRGELYWGHRLQAVREPRNPTLEDEGVQFALVASF